MTSNAAALAATVILLFSMGYFFLASPAFLLVKLDIPQVAQLLRGMFNVQFVIMSVAGAFGTLAFAAAGHPAFAVGVGLVTAFAILGRRWFLGRMDAELHARDAGDVQAVRRLRRLHWAGMACNAILLFAFVGGIPYATA